jgi:hypothetical protein
MLLGQLLVMALAAVKRFDAVALHAWESAREVFGNRRSSDEGLAE